MHPSALLTVALGALACARPALKPEDVDTKDPDSWSPPLRAYFEAVGQRIEKFRLLPTFPKPPACNLDNAVMATAPTPLPAPLAGLKLMHVAIGRGTQNYTCATRTSASTPVANGATAKLYNATCIAANYPKILAALPNAALQFDTPGDSSPISPPRIELSGHHFFPDATTPGFFMDTEKHSYGTYLLGKKASSPAPSNAPKGQGGKGFGSVPWLLLQTKTNGTATQQVYRLNTAGGVAPATCEGMASTFEIEYATEYWFLQ
ncbi:MAG: hypothetical protein M1832_005023 [Thelocarpon impressellum]|nr:MAG: hypothetical protein M1832_005023 [Thelocarpon impressellum]